MCTTATTVRQSNERAREKKRNAENNFLKKKSSATAAIATTHKKQLALFFPLYYTYFHFVCCFRLDGVFYVCVCMWIFYAFKRRIRKKNIALSCIPQCANFCFFIRCFDENLSHLSVECDFRSILNLCTLCYRALYRRLSYKTTDAGESSKKKTQNNKTNEKYIILLYFGAAKLLFSCCAPEICRCFFYRFQLYFF